MTECVILTLLTNGQLFLTEEMAHCSVIFDTSPHFLCKFPYRYPDMHFLIPGEGDQSTDL